MESKEAEKQQDKKAERERLKKEKKEKKEKAIKKKLEDDPNPKTEKETQEVKSTQEKPALDQAKQNPNVVVKPKKRLFCLTRYEELEESPAPVHHATGNSKSNHEDHLCIHGRKQLEVSEQNASLSSSKQIIEKLIALNLTNLNEELFILFLKLARNQFKDQRMICRDLIVAVIRMINKIEIENNSREYINTIISKFEKIKKMM